MIDCRWKRVYLQIENRHKRQQTKNNERKRDNKKRNNITKNNLIKEQYEEN